MFRVDWAHAAGVLGQDARVAAAWVFGSAQEGLVRPGSDLDLAVLFFLAPSLDDCADLRAALQEALRFEDVDLLVLNRASPVVAFEAVSGRRICCKDEEVCAAFVSLAAREYEDEMAFAKRGLGLQGLNRRAPGSRNSSAQ
ncbi:MAG: type VII toxin-antitoxin system MntA family adenylyltransferase antitoxin [Deferrisomatales bacterium]